MPNAYQLWKTIKSNPVNILRYKFLKIALLAKRKMWLGMKNDKSWKIINTHVKQGGKVGKHVILIKYNKLLMKYDQRKLIYYKYLLIEIRFINISDGH